MLQPPFVGKWVSLYHSQVFVFTLIFTSSYKASRHIPFLGHLAQVKENKKSFSQSKSLFICDLCNANTIRLQAGKVKNMNKLLQWSGNIINHFWHCCKTCEGDPMKLKVQLCVTITPAKSSTVF